MKRQKTLLFRSAFKGYVETVLIALVVAVILRFFVIAAYKIPTLSMLPNLAVGDFILVNQMSYGFKIPFTDNRIGGSLPNRGEVVVFRCPQNPDSHCVKRVIGLPGDRVEVKRGQLFLNGIAAKYQASKLKSSKLLIGELKEGEKYRVLSERNRNMSHLIMLQNKKRMKNFPPRVVPPGHFYTIGDFRPASEDSREWGPIPQKDLIGRAVFVWLSLDWSSVWKGEASWPRVRGERILKSIR